MNVLCWEVPAPSRWVSQPPLWICCPCLHPGASRAGQLLCTVVIFPRTAALRSCHLSLHLPPLSLVWEGLEQMQSSRSEQPQVPAMAPTRSSVPLQHCVCISAQMSPQWPLELLPKQ